MSANLETLPLRSPVATLDVVAVTGNPRAGSRTAGLARHVAMEIAGRVAGLERARLVEIDLAAALAPGEDRVAALRGATIAVIASPTYKATYTGLLKTLLDAVPHDGLAGVIAIPLMVAGDRVHALAVELHLRPVLVELGAITPTRGLFFEEASLAAPGAVLDPWLERARPVLDALVTADLRP
ncbi:MAG: reductase [Gaiellales bacterium]|jgi:FMN reductase|nr:reductase [Gaiellales bacterium]